MMRAVMRARRRGDKGAAAVEFALISIPLFTLLFGIVEFGFVFFSQITLTQAAREGARALSLQQPCDASCQSAIQTRVIGETSGGVNLTASNFTLMKTCNAGDTEAKSAEVKLTYTVSITLLFPVTIKADVSMPCGG